MKRAYAINEFYTLEQIRGIAERFKTVVSKSSPLGLLHLYREKDTDFFWLGGPLKGPNTNLFMYLGSQKSREQALATVSSALAIVFQETRKRRKETGEGPDHFDDQLLIDDLLDLIDLSDKLF